MKKSSKIILGIILLLILLIIIYFSKCKTDPDTNTPPTPPTTTNPEIDYGDFIPNQYVLSFSDSVLENGIMVPLDSAQIEALIDSFIVQGDTILRRCMCNKMVLVAPIDTVTPQERQQEARSKLEPQGDEAKKYGVAGLNYFLQFNPVTDSVNLNYQFGFQSIKYREPSPNDKKTIVAIVDTGFNPSHNELVNRVWINPREQSDALDNDKNCIINDFNGVDIPTHQPGFSFSDGHGTAVAGKVMGALGNGYPSDVDIQLVNVKFTHLDPATNRQTGDLFDAVCGMRYSISAGASVMTASFGLYQDSVSTLLEEVVLQAKKHNVTIIAAAGNDSIDIDTLPFYPASFARMAGFENVISVGAVDDSNTLAGFSNHGKESVLLAAPGVNQDILPLLTAANDITMSGTSIAVPIVASTASIIKAHNPDISPTDLRLCLFKGVSSDTTLIKQINKGIFNPNDALESCGITPH